MVQNVKNGIMYGAKYEKHGTFDCFCNRKVKPREVKKSNFTLPLLYLIICNLKQPLIHVCTQFTLPHCHTVLRMTHIS